MSVTPYRREPAPTQAWKPPCEAILSLTFTALQKRLATPAMLVVSMVALAVVLLPVMLLALTRGVWALVLAALSIFAALGLLAGAFEAAVADADTRPRDGDPELRALRHD